MNENGRQNGRYVTIRYFWAGAMTWGGALLATLWILLTTIVHKFEERIEQRFDSQRREIQVIHDRMNAWVSSGELSPGPEEDQ